MSSNEFAIKISNLSKCYEVYSRPADRLKQFIYPAVKRLLGRNPNNYYREFWALKDVSFDVRRGEAVGIVGRNGAGKSTLLQLIAGTLAPTSGDVQVNGRVAALLELGSGFNPEFTGRENVYLNASILGLSAQEVDKRFEEIASFADIGDFIDQPLSTYSSGMMMRLAFAVNTCVSPDILIVDEALGVGDAPFQAKCFKRLRELSANGTSLLFVSHDIEIVRSLCSRALWLKKGVPENWGEAKEVTKGYERYCWEEQGVTLKSSEVKQNAQGSDDEPKVHKTPVSKNNAKTSAASIIGTGSVTINKFLLKNSRGEFINKFNYNDNVEFIYYITLNEDIKSDFVVGIRLKDIKGNFVLSINDAYNINILNGKKGERFKIKTSANLNLCAGYYSILTGIFGFSEGSAYSHGLYDFNKSIIWDLRDDLTTIQIIGSELMPLPGPVHQSSDLRIEIIKE
jgi:lipopolysaccharide transport system ATP-binding protein